MVKKVVNDIRKMIREDENGYIFLLIFIGFILLCSVWAGYDAKVNNNVPAVVSHGGWLEDRF